MDKRVIAVAVVTAAFAVIAAPAEERVFMLALIIMVYVLVLFIRQEINTLRMAQDKAMQEEKFHDDLAVIANHIRKQIDDGKI